MDSFRSFLLIPISRKGLIPAHVQWVDRSDPFYERLCALVRKSQLLDSFRSDLAIRYGLKVSPISVVDRFCLKKICEQPNEGKVRNVSGSIDKAIHSTCIGSRMLDRFFLSLANVTAVHAQSNIKLKRTIPTFIV